MKSVWEKKKKPNAQKEQNKPFKHHLSFPPSLHFAQEMPLADSCTLKDSSKYLFRKVQTCGDVLSAKVTQNMWTSTGTLFQKL